jgi:ketosteroid isomerase-like protein
MFKLVLAATLLVSAMAANAAAVAAEKGVAATIIAMERAALDGSDRGDVDRFLELSAPNIVYMDPGLEQPIVGIADLTVYYRKVFVPEAVPTVAGEMLHSQVQVMGDTAVLTFNYIVKKLRGGDVVRRWNATEVYHRSGKRWRIVNTHWSFTQPKLAERTS